MIRLGDVAIATNVFELFTEFGIQIKARSRALQTFVIQLAGPGFVPADGAPPAAGATARSRRATSWDPKGVRSSRIGPWSSSIPSGWAGSHSSPARAADAQSSWGRHGLFLHLTLMIVANPRPRGSRLSVGINLPPEAFLDYNRVARMGRCYAHSESSGGVVSMTRQSMNRSRRSRSDD